MVGVNDGVYEIKIVWKRERKGVGRGGRGEEGELRGGRIGLRG